MAEPLFRVTFLNQGQVYELYARAVGPAAILGFVEISELVFGERTQIVVDPSEERLRHEFEGVKRFSVPMHAVVRIDEVERQGQSRISEVAKGNVTAFPVPYFRPGREGGES